MIKRHIKILLLVACIFTASLLGGVIVNDSSSNIAKSGLETKHISNISTTATLPTKYDLKEDIYIGVENQNPYGICYAYASLTSLETYLALHYGEYYDFSELHFALSLYKQAGYHNDTESALKDGGNFSHFVTYTQKDKALVLEDEMPMSKYLKIGTDIYNTDRLDAMSNDYTAINSNFYPLVKVNNTKSFPQYLGNKANYNQTELKEFRNNVKQHIMTYGSLTAGIHTKTITFNNDTTYLKVTNNNLITDEDIASNNTDHLVSIVGWDDTYMAPGWSNPGAYLCLNSWGESFGLDGYFYVSYDDYFIESTIQGVVDASLCTTNNKISTIASNPNNTFILTHTFSTCDLYYVNIINTSSYINQQINYIDTFVKGGSAEFYIKFFNSESTAWANINNITSLDRKGCTKIDEYSIYNKYALKNPLTIGNNYMAIVTCVNSASKAHSLGGFLKSSADTLGLPVTYYAYGLGGFGSLKWKPDVSGKIVEACIPVIIHTNKQYVSVPKFTGTTDSFIDSSHKQNNAIFYGKTINLELINAGLKAESAVNVKITKLFTDSFTDYTSKFTISVSSNTLNIFMKEALSANFTSGNYLIKIPCDNTTIYKVISVQDVEGYPIVYHLDGGSAPTNPTIYTDNQTVLSLIDPIKDGYVFIGWYTDSGFTNKFDPSHFNPSSLYGQQLDLYAKYDFAAPTIKSKSDDIHLTYYNGFSREISVNATHALLEKSEYNASLNYQWYYRASINDDFTLLLGATTNTLLINSVKQSGYYACEISISFTDPSTNEPYTKTLEKSTTNQISVNIKPYVYDMSKVMWTYSSPIVYNGQSHRVEVVNLPDGVAVTYTNNEFIGVGTYVASAEISYNNMDGNATANPIENLEWEIRKAKITITIEDIITTKAISNEMLNTMYDCDIDFEYLPDSIETKQDIINYLQIAYLLQDTENSYIKTINATHKTFESNEDFYDIEIIPGEYRIVVYELTSNNISANNSKGFAQDCQFTAYNAPLSESANRLLADQDLTAVQCYTLSYSYLQKGDSVIINIPMERKQLFNKLAIYTIQNDKLVKLDCKVGVDGISFTTNLKEGTYIIATEDLSHTSNVEMIIIVVVIGLYVVLCAYALISGIKHKNDYYI